MRSLHPLLIIILILFTTGCSSIKRDWDSATRVNNTYAYHIFLSKHPDSQYSTDAKARIEKIKWEQEKADWEQIESSLQTINFRKFLKKHPDSKYSSIAQAKIATFMKRDWEKIKNSDSVYDFRNFIFWNPDSEFNSEANAKIVEITRDSWDKARLENKAYSYRSFIEKFPKCEFTPEALNYLKQLQSHKAVIVLEVPEILSIGENYNIVFKETNGLGVIFKEHQYYLYCDNGVWKKPGTKLQESNWIRVPPNGETKYYSYVPLNWANCTEIKSAWFSGYDDNGNDIKVQYSYRIKVK